MPNKINYQSGQALLIATILFTLISAAVVGSFLAPIVRTTKVTQELKSGDSSYYLSESGIEDVVYRLKAGVSVSTSEILSLNGNSVTTNIATVSDGKIVTSNGDWQNRLRNIQTKLTIGSGASFNFGVQTDEGGFVMLNSSSVSGNLYSNGSVVGSGSSIVRGDIVSAGSGGSVSGVHATGTVYAHTISNSVIDKDAYYQQISGSTVTGISHPGAVDQATSSLPIDDALIDEWEAAALAGGEIDCASSPYKITAARTIGPVKINCDLEISGTNYDVTLGGNVWVTGNIEVKNSPTLKAAPSLGSASVAMIADKPTDQLTSSRIILNNSSIFEGSGSEGSYVLMLSENGSAKAGGSVIAIDVGNSATGDLLVYAGKGEIRLANSVSLKQVTAYRIRLANTANVVYETGLASLLFTSGPGGSWDITNWLETP